jgi:GTPase
MENRIKTSNELPTLVIVGRPNVGKSTLFNRLIGRRRAIVGDEPGITRDRLYGEAEWTGRRMRVIDTGGIIPEDKQLIPSEIFRQAKVALEEAHAIVMVVDGRTELAAPDLELSRLLLHTGKPLFLAVNKMDTVSMETQAEEFHRLGIRNLFAVSAENGNGVGELLDEVVKTFPPKTPAEEEEPVTDRKPRSKRSSRRLALSEKHAAESAEAAAESAEANAESTKAQTESANATSANAKGVILSDGTPSFGGRERRISRAGAEMVSPDQTAEAPMEHEVKVAIIGRPNVGKSTLLNALSGTGRAIVSPIPGTTRDAVDELIERDGQTFRIIDTAGIRRKGKTHLMAEKLSVVMARKHLEAADIALLMIDATEGVTALDANIAGYAHESGRSVIIVVNKWDLVGQAQPHQGARKDFRLLGTQSTKKVRAEGGKLPADRKLFEQQARNLLKFINYAPMVFISAAKNKGMDSIFAALARVAAERRKRVTTAEMNRFLKSVDFERASVPRSKKVKIYYMTQAQTSPPTFILFTDRNIKLHFSYQRFLENQIRHAFGFEGTPIWIKTRESGR